MGECFKRDFYEHEIRVQRLSVILELACSWPIGAHLRPADVEIDIFVSSTSDSYLITSVHMKQLRNSSLVGNTRRFVDETDLAGSEGLEGMNPVYIKPRNFFSFPLATVLSCCFKLPRTKSTSPRKPFRFKEASVVSACLIISYTHCGRLHSAADAEIEVIFKSTSDAYRREHIILSR